MSAELSVLSFLLAVLLAAYIPIKRVRNNVANLAVVLWLVVCNLIHGINAIQWAGNVDMSSPGWCDIATRISLAFYIALPAACICMSRELESKSSQRIISKDIRSARIRALIDILICYVLPMLYLILHYVVQSHRFDIIKDYGCFASIHPSGPALLIITLTPTLLCSISLVFSGLTIRNLLRERPDANGHISNSSYMILGPLVYRRLAISIPLTVVIIVFLIVSVASMPILEAWISFAQVHVDITEINIVQVPSLISTLKRTWWGIFAVSIVYLVLLVTLGEETRDMYKWIVKRLTKLRRRKAKPPLPLYLLDKVNSSRSQSPPQTVELKSGWDDMPEFSPASRSFFRSALRMSKPKHAQAPSSPSSNATIRTLSPLITSMDQSPNSSLQSIASVDKDNAFMSNTLRYLESPTARSLGISPPSPVYGLLMRGTEHTTPTIESGRIPLRQILDQRQSISSTGNTLQATGLTPTGTKKEIENSTISSVFDAAWPLPPVAPVTPSSRYTTLQ